MTFSRGVIVSLTADQYEEQRRRLDFGEWFPATRGHIPTTYQRLAQHGVDQGWDETVLVTQDDIDISGVRWHPGRIVCYGGRTPRRAHLAPWAFAASRQGWADLARVWDGQAHICYAWEPVVTTERHQAFHLGPITRHPRSVSGW